MTAENNSRKMGFADQTKRAAAVLTNFRDHYFNGDTKQLINNTLLYYEICANQFNTTNSKEAI